MTLACKQNLVVFPTASMLPPMIKMCLTFLMKSGSSLEHKAMFVRGPKCTRLTSPENFPYFYALVQTGRLTSNNLFFTTEFRIINVIWQNRSPFSGVSVRKMLKLWKFKELFIITRADFRTPRGISYTYAIMHITDSWNYTFYTCCAILLSCPLKPDLPPTNFMMKTHV